jgi:predicted cobalt transporter CbtA
VLRSSALLPTKEKTMIKLFRAGALAGAAGGAVLAATLVLFGEGPLGTAVTIEQEHASGGAHDELFTRGVQQVGGALGAVLYGIVLGLVFALVFACVRHRLAMRSDRSRSLTVAAAGFTAVTLVPFVLYPPNPPGVGGEDTVGTRTGAYVLAVGWSVTALIAAAVVARRLRHRGVDQTPAVIAALAVHLGLVVIAAMALPVRELATDIPAELVWELRLSSLLGGTALWAAMGFVFPMVAAPVLDGGPRNGLVDV